MDTDIWFNGLWPDNSRVQKDLVQWIISRRAFQGSLRRLFSPGALCKDFYFVVQHSRWIWDDFQSQSTHTTYHNMGMKKKSQSVDHSILFAWLVLPSQCLWFACLKIDCILLSWWPLTGTTCWAERLRSCTELSDWLKLRLFFLRHMCWTFRKRETCSLPAAKCVFWRTPWWSQLPAHSFMISWSIWDNFHVTLRWKTQHADRKAMEGTEWAQLGPLLVGSNMFVFVESDRDLKPAIQVALLGFFFLNLCLHASTAPNCWVAVFECRYTGVLQRSSKSKGLQEPHSCLTGAQAYIKMEKQFDRTATWQEKRPGDSEVFAWMPCVLWGCPWCY